MNARSAGGKTPRSNNRLCHSAFCIVFFALAPTAFPQQPTTVRLWNWNIHDKKYQQKMYKLFNERHPEIKIEYSSIATGAYDQTLEAAYAAKDPPDLFLPSGKLSFGYLKTRNMIMPLNDVAGSQAELQQWMSAYPPLLHKFIEGISVFDGKAYVVDLWGEGGAAGMYLYYNKTLFKESGIANPPLTYSQFRQSASKIAAAGQGKYFGFAHGLRFSGVWDQDLSIAFAGGARGYNPTGWPDLRDGKFHSNSPVFITAMKTLIGIREDGSVFPGDTTMDDEQAKMTLATNKAGMFIGGNWVLSNILAYNAEVDFDLVLPPGQDDGSKRFFFYANPVGGTFGYVVSSFTKNPKAVWEVIRFLCSLEYQEGYVKGGYGISFLPEANKPENFSVPQSYKFVQWAMDPTLSRVSPPLGEGAFKVWGFLPGIYPPWQDVMANLYLGKAGFETLEDMDRRANAALDTAFEKARESGLKITREEVFVFPDYDYSKDYVPKKK